MEIPYSSENTQIDEKESVTSDRKLAHLQICLEHDVQAQSVTTGLDDISFIHRATTELSLKEIDLSTVIFDKKLSIPLIISGMTGGHNFAYKLNHFLSEVVDKLNIGMGVGSQRAALEDNDLRETFKIVREKAPNSLIIGNIGAGQIALGLSEKEFKEITEMIEATAIAIHFNPLQEAIQPEGDTDLKDLITKTTKVVRSSNVPVIAKEVGSGFSYKDITLIKSMGFSAIDIQGVGGTSWAGVESIRATTPILKKAGEIFWDWGIPTAVSTILAAKNFEGVIIGSGGVRNGLDIAKLIALGADAGAMAIPFLFATQSHSTDSVITLVKEIEYQIRLACFLTGCQSINELKRAPLLITGKTAETLKSYGIQPKEYLERGKK